MTISIADINWLAVAVATVAYFLLGGLWFSPFVFSKHYDKAIGFDRLRNWKWTSIYFIGPFLGCLLASFAIAVLTNTLNINSTTQAITFGLVAGLGISSSVSFVNAITPKMPLPILFGLITGMYHLVGITIATIIIYAMTK